MKMKTLTFSRGGTVDQADEMANPALTMATILARYYGFDVIDWDAVAALAKACDEPAANAR